MDTPAVISINNFLTVFWHTVFILFIVQIYYDTLLVINQEGGVNGAHFIL